jgi:hypothetical protein
LGGSWELLNIEEAPIVSESFSVGFFFKNGKLVCVNIRRTANTPGSMRAGLFALTPRIGREIRVCERRGGFGWSARRSGYHIGESGGAGMMLSKELNGAGAVLALCCRTGAAAAALDNL